MDSCLTVRCLLPPPQTAASASVPPSFARCALPLRCPPPLGAQGRPRGSPAPSTACSYLSACCTEAPKGSCEAAPSAGFTVLEVSSDVPVLPMQSAPWGSGGKVVHAQLAPAQPWQQGALAAHTPGHSTGRKGLLAPLLVSAAHHYSRARVSHRLHPWWGTGT